MTEKKTISQLISTADFKNLWFVGAVSMSNQWLEMLAISVFVYAATGSALAVTFTNLARAIPMVVFGAFIGSISDSINKKFFLFISFGILFLSSLVLSITSFFGHIEIWHIALGMFLTGIVFSSDFPIRRNMLGEVSGIENIGKGMGLDSIARNGTRIIGPLIGGSLMEYIGLHGAYLVMATFYFLNSIQLILLKNNFHNKNYLKKNNYFSLVIEGIKYVRKNTQILGFLFVTIIMNIFAFPYIMIVPILAQDKLSISPLLTGILVSFEGLGAMIGAGIIVFLRTKKYFKKIYFFGSCIFMLAIILFGLSNIYSLSIIIIFLGGVGVGCFSTMQGTLPFLIAPQEMRARTLGLVSVCIGVNPIGIIFIGFMAALLSPTYALVISGSLGVFSMFILALIIKKTI
ncbi:MFS transporter [Alphaproteobacteria bacterium]|nr:MFS transporter [Alphaproteobacteria bacterium]